MDPEFGLVYAQATAEEFVRSEKAEILSMIESVRVQRLSTAAVALCFVFVGVYELAKVYARLVFVANARGFVARIVE